MYVGQRFAGNGPNDLSYYYYYLYVSKIFSQLSVCNLEAKYLCFINMASLQTGNDGSSVGCVGYQPYIELSIFFSSPWLFLLSIWLTLQFSICKIKWGQHILAVLRLTPLELRHFRSNEFPRTAFFGIGWEAFFNSMCTIAPKHRTCTPCFRSHHQRIEYETDIT